MATDMISDKDEGGALLIIPREVMDGLLYRLEPHKFKIAVWILRHTLGSASDWTPLTGRYSLARYLGMCVSTMDRHLHQGVQSGLFECQEIDKQLLLRIHPDHLNSLRHSVDRPTNGGIPWNKGRLRLDEKRNQSWAKRHFGHLHGEVCGEYRIELLGDGVHFTPMTRSGIKVVLGYSEERFCNHVNALMKRLGVQTPCTTSNLE